MTYPIQSIIAPAFARPEALYIWSDIHCSGFEGDAPWRLEPGDTMVLDAYFNALFPDIWQKYTAVTRFGARFDLSGQARVQIWARLRDDSSVCLADQLCSTQVEIMLDSLPEETGRLNLRVVALGQVVLQGLDWITDTAPCVPVNLSVGLCTFNRESFLAETVAALVGQIAKTPEIKQIYVVNQGKSFTDPDLLELIDGLDVTLCEQANLGGCGGFTRTMVESINAVIPTTHHLLMDDDIVLDPRVLERVVAFLSYCTAEVALGGQMLELERPTRLYEAGGRLHPLWFVENVGHGQDMAHPHTLRLFHDTPQIDYNAWWFCVIPTRTIRRIGLPPPIFIRGDDLEYGCRMKDAGVDTVPLPGCAVWHEGFAYKTSDWLLYYDLRNRLIISSLHPDGVTTPDGLYLLGFVMAIILQHRYRAARVALKAIADSMAPIDLAMGVTLDAKHAELLAFLKRLPEIPVVSRDEVPDTVREGRLRPLNPAIPAMVYMCVTQFIGLHLVRLLPFRKRRWFPAQPQANAVGLHDYYAALDPEQTKFGVYSSNLLQLWVLTARTFALCIRYAFKARGVATRRTSEMDARRTENAWRTMFQTPRS
ncbi:glycosyltransferase family 2 protein [Roseibaca sp. V10]|mgnify:CR=1 FL=1|uniref:Glycosyltransferase family 2 protein n=1 Tax=Roseinatronobacter domitianus TaxID=2940293 RepID=A0ABT0M5M9_9RHOB|nr:glycosyltransferase [Roseibaca domitiana]MCL1630153.1 glycosyltransferase family 2 protein [Roseibaca domitiana]